MKIDNYRNHILVAMPSLQDDFFSRAVVFVCEHSVVDGAVGFIINKPLSATLNHVFEYLKIPIEDQRVMNIPVFSGGPVSPDQGFVLHDRLNKEECELGQNITISASREILTDIAAGKGPDNYLITLGYTGWEAKQLEEEVLRNDWLVVPFQKQLLFEIPIAERWLIAAQSVGVDMNKLSVQIGHA